MLKSIKGHAAYHFQAAINSLNFLCTRPLSSMTTVLVIAIALTLPALFWVCTDNLGKLTIDWKSGGHISLYLKSQLTADEEKELLTKISAVQQVAKATLKTKAQGLLELQQQEGMQDIMLYLPENPLPAVIDVVPESSVNNPVKMKAFFEHLKTFSEIEEAKLDLEWITRLHAVLGFVDSVANAVMILLASAVVLIVGNTLRLAIHNRREEIQVLKLIGATDAFILRPFLYSGVWYGLAGAVFAVLFVNIFMLTVAMSVEKLVSVYHMHYPLLGLSVKQAYLIVFAAIILGWLGARLSVKRQLAMIEPTT